jgi:serine/threonine-protein kinase
MAPKQIGRYELKHELGRGGMATVYLAHDPQFQRDVAVKLLPRDLLHEASFKSRFTREAQTIAALEHPAIVPVYDFGEEDGQPYLVMRHMPGGSLADRIENGHYSIEMASEILKRIGSALDYAHSQGVVHRDLKPANILFDKFDNSYLADFGIARLAEASTALTGTNTIIGTPAYMSPEQVHGDEVLDGRSDIYSLAIILFEMLTGKQPFEADTPAKVMMKHILDPVPNVLDANPDLPLDSRSFFSIALAKDREERYAKAEILSSELENLITRKTHTRSLADETYVEQIETLVEQPSEPEKKTVVETPPPIPQQLPSEGVKGGSTLIQNPIRILGIVGLTILLLVGGALVFNKIRGSLSPDEAVLNERPEGSPISKPTEQTIVNVEETPALRAETATPGSGPLTNSSLGKEIVARGTIRVGVHYLSGIWPFSVIDVDEEIHTGFEFELTKEIINRLFSDSVSIEWIYTSAVDRLTSLQAGDFDLLARNTTHTVSRDEYGLWTSNYFLGGLRLLVFRRDGYSEIEDMNGQQVSTLAGTTNELIISQVVEDLGLDIDIATFEQWDDAMHSFESGESVAFVGWWLSLLDARGRDDSYEVIGRLLIGSLDGTEVGREPIAFGIPPGQEDFRDEVNAVLMQIIQDGTWQDLYDRWFPGSPPWTTEEMLAEPPLNR